MRLAKRRCLVQLTPVVRMTLSCHPGGVAMEVLPRAADAGGADDGVLHPRKRLRGKQQKPTNYPETPPVLPFYCPMQGDGLGMALAVNYLAEPFATCGG